MSSVDDAINRFPEDIREPMHGFYVALRKEIGDVSKGFAETHSRLDRVDATLGRVFEGLDRLEQAQARTEATVAGLSEAQARTDTSVRELSEAQARTEASVRELSEAQARTEATVAGLSEGQERLFAAQARTDETLEKLVAAQARTEATVAGLSEGQERLFAAQARTEASVARLSEGQERLFAAQARTEETVERFGRNFEFKMGGLGSRWGMMSEGAFRAGAEEILTDAGFSVERFDRQDTEGMVFGRSARIELDVVISNGTTILVEIKSSADYSDVYVFKEKSEFYNSVADRPADKLVLVAPYVTPRAAKLAHTLRVTVCTSPEDMENIA